VREKAALAPASERRQPAVVHEVYSHSFVEGVGDLRTGAITIKKHRGVEGQSGATCG
jgi:hypothetical protein